MEFDRVADKDGERLVGIERGCYRLREADRDSWRLRGTDRDG